MVESIHNRQGISIRRLCKVVRRASLYYKSKGKNEDELIGSTLKEKSNQVSHWGFRLLFYWCRNQGYVWNKKRVYRVYKQLKLNLRSPVARKKIKRVAISPLPAQQINQGWSMDFLSDVFSGNKQMVRILNIMDECSRKVLLSLAGKSISAAKVAKLLKELISTYGKPAYLRGDNGAEFISKKMENFAQSSHIQIRFSQPGKPTQNGLVERLNGTLRKECLNKEYFKTVAHLQKALDKWWNNYNFDRPHSALGYLTPQKFIENNQNLHFNLATL